MIDFSFIENTFAYLLTGLTITLEISLIGFAIGFLLSAFMTPVRMFGGRFLGSIVTSYVEALRGTPLLVQIFFVYFGLPYIGIKFDPITAGILTLGLNSAAYQAEILRGSINAIPIEQYYSAQSLGMKPFHMYKYVILPQAVRYAIPALMNELVTLIKESSLVSVIGVAELTRKGEYIVATTFRAFEVYLLVALVYFIICYALVKISKIIEVKIKIPGYMPRRL
ncbi:MAG: amino acid ABC transporter permease [Thermoprotei archaeon]|jgi:polar amino acid transport system permease protein